MLAAWGCVTLHCDKTMLSILARDLQRHQIPDPVGHEQPARSGLHCYVADASSQRPQVPSGTGSRRAASLTASAACDAEVPPVTGGCTACRAFLEGPFLKAHTEGDELRCWTKICLRTCFMVHGISGFDGGGLWVLTSTMCRHLAIICGDGPMRRAYYHLIVFNHMRVLSNLLHSAADVHTSAYF